MFLMSNPNVRLNAALWILGTLMGCAAQRGARISVAPATDSALMQALEAQVVWIGRCSRITQVDRVPTTPFFRDIEFFEGRCRAEHDESDQTVAYAARDQAGTVFVLGSAPALEFLRLRHPPVTLDSTNVLEFAALVARLMGCWSYQVLPNEAADPAPSPANPVLGTRLTGCWPPGATSRGGSGTPRLGVDSLPRVERHEVGWAVRFTADGPNVSVRFRMEISRVGKVNWFEGVVVPAN